MKPLIFLLFIVAAMSLVSIIVTIYDKIAAKKLPKHRTRESSLIILSVLGGSVAMLATMLLIRHKTKHAKFMVGIPLIIILQLAALICTHIYVIPLF